ncbi:MAG TPA: hypothetical protein ENG40_04660, partial [Thermoprotei archaeon]|nr:hypothetical protein [Thermoprotei archaeon]
MIRDLINIFLKYFNSLVLFLSNILGVQREVLSILLIELFLLISTLIWIKTRSLRLKRKFSQLIVEAEISKKLSSIELSKIEMFKISFLSLKISILYAIAVIIM